MQQRQQRLASTIHKLAATAIANIDTGAYVTVTSVNVSPDLRHASIWVSVMEGDADEVLAVVVSRQGDIRTHIARNTRLRKVPAINIRLDRGGETAQRIRQRMQR